MKALTPVPAEYLKPIENGGKIVRVDYKSNTYDAANEELDKFAYVYLPYGYDENKKYDILYCFHGGGGEIEVYFGTEEKPAPVKLTLDSMIANGDIEPIIAVSPTYYTGKPFKGMGGAADVIRNFKHELINDLIPAIEGKFSTYAETTDRAGIKASRDHRGYTGYSMGSLSTWYAYVNCLDAFHYYMPMSGDLWVTADTNTGGDENAAAAAKLLEKTFQESGLTEKDFYIYAITGDKDAAFKPMTDLTNAIKAYAPSFHFITDENPDGNISFFAEPEATHDYFYMPLYFYNALPKFWK